MPGLICPTHRNTYMVLVCQQIKEGVASGHLPEKIITMFVDYGMSFGDGPLYFKHFYCPVCAEQYGHPAEDTLATGEEFESMSEMRLIPDCEDCFREALNRERRKTGASVPAGVRLSEYEQQLVGTREGSSFISNGEA